MKVRKIYEDLIHDLNLDGDEVPLFAGETLRQEEGGVCYGHNDIIARLPDMMNAYVVSSEGCAGASDGLHFTAAGYRELGKHYAMSVLKSVYRMLPGMPERPAERLTLEEANMEIQIGTGKELNLTADFGGGYAENIHRQLRVEQPCGGTHLQREGNRTRPGGNRRESHLHRPDWPDAHRHFHPESHLFPFQRGVHPHQPLR